MIDGLYAHFLYIFQGAALLLCGVALTVRWLLYTVLEQKVCDLLAPTIETLGFELWGCELAGHARHLTLRIYIDSDAGITIDDCSRVSHQVSGILDVEDPISGSYDLEVSSPGADRQLFKMEHYQRFIGEEIKLRLLNAVDNRRNITGVIRLVEGDKVFVQDGEKEFVVTLDNIDKARVEVGS